MIVCWSVKGGSGTTVVAAALALVLAQRLDVGARLIDTSGDTPSALGMSEPASEGIAEWLSATDHPGVDALNNLMLPVTAHLGVIPRGRNIIVPSLVNPDRLRDLAHAVAQSPVPTVVDAGSGLATIPIIEYATRSLLIILNVGLVVRDQLAVWHAASAGARAASISPDSPGIVKQAVEDEVGLRPLHLQIVRDEQLITVKVQYPRTINLWLIKHIVPPLTLSASVTMHVQDVG